MFQDVGSSDGASSGSRSRSSLRALGEQRQQQGGRTAKEAWSEDVRAAAIAPPLEQEDSAEEAEEEQGEEENVDLFTVRVLQSGGDCVQLEIPSFSSRLLLLSEGPFQIRLESSSACPMIAKLEIDGRATRSNYRILPRGTHTIRETRGGGGMRSVPLSFVASDAQRQPLCSVDEMALRTGSLRVMFFAVADAAAGAGAKWQLARSEAPEATVALRYGFADPIARFFGLNRLVLPSPHRSGAHGSGARNERAAVKVAQRHRDAESRLRTGTDAELYEPGAEGAEGGGGGGRRWRAAHRSGSASGRPPAPAVPASRAPRGVCARCAQACNTEIIALEMEVDQWRARCAELQRRLNRERKMGPGVFDRLYARFATPPPPSLQQRVPVAAAGGAGGGGAGMAAGSREGPVSCRAQAVHSAQPTARHDAAPSGRPRVVGSTARTRHAAARHGPVAPARAGSATRWDAAAEHVAYSLHGETIVTSPASQPPRSPCHSAGSSRSGGGGVLSASTTSEDVASDGPRAPAAGEEGRRRRRHRQHCGERAAATAAPERPSAVVSPRLVSVATGSVDLVGRVGAQPEQRPQPPVLLVVTEPPDVATATAVPVPVPGAAPQRGLSNPARLLVPPRNRTPSPEAQAASPRHSDHRPKHESPPALSPAQTHAVRVHSSPVKIEEAGGHSSPPARRRAPPPPATIGGESGGGGDGAAMRGGQANPGGPGGVGGARLRSTSSGGCGGGDGATSNAPAREGGSKETWGDASASAGAHQRRRPQPHSESPPPHRPAPGAAPGAALSPFRDPFAAAAFNRSPGDETQSSDDDSNDRRAAVAAARGGRARDLHQRAHEQDFSL